MKTLAELQPTQVWSIFDEITRIPRPSKHEEGVRTYLRDFATKHALAFKEDAKGNVVIRKNATEGYENREGVVLQSHMDMVCEKEPSSTHDFMRDPIQAYVDGDWVKAKGTTLGADCGIGMALQLAVLSSTHLAHPMVEALFTVDEEQGLSGAVELGADMLTASRMINLDSEDDGEIFIGCAGGVDTVATFEYKSKKAKKAGYQYFRLSVDSLTGGHSGDDIEKGRANANKLLARFLWEFFTAGDVRLSAVDGGNLRNAIPRNAWAVVGVPDGLEGEVAEIFNTLAKDIKAEFAQSEPNVELALVRIDDTPVHVISRSVAHLLVAALVGVPNGVLGMSLSMPGLVESSANLASVKMKGQDQIVVVTSQRSSVESFKHVAAMAAESVFLLAEADVEHSNDYPGWTPNPSSPFVESATQIYKKLFDHAPKVKAIHAGLECGLFLTKYPDMDMISIGPTIRGVHSPSERLDIVAVDKTWRFLTALLAH